MVNQEVEKLDLKKVASLQQKRSLAFVNHFVTTTVQFLNQFMKKCEYKLMQFESKLEKLEAAMILLEARLSSIPEVNNVHDTAKNIAEVPTDPKNSEQQSEKTDIKENEDPIEESSTIKEDITSEINKEYERFVKMVQVGVPLDAVKLKVSLEGLDSSLLEKILNK